MSVISFYSYKGGVGRTFLAVETAAQLARRGMRVCVWDLDLEAPALHRHSQLQNAIADLKSGTIDLIETAAVNGSVSGESVDAALVHLPIANEARLSFLLPAGAASLDGAAGDSTRPYAERYWAIDWATELASNRAVNSFLSITDHLAGQFDLVIIDARTGLTDLGYLSSRVLADAVVLVFGLSEQNLEGLRTASSAMARQVGSEPAPPTFRIANLVPDKVERASNPRLAAAYRAQAEALSDRGLDPDLELPLVPARLIDDLVPSLPGGLEEEAEPFGPLVEWVLDHTEAASTSLPSNLARPANFELEIASILTASGWTSVDSGRRPDLDQRADLVMRPPAGSYTQRPVLIDCAKDGVGPVDVVRLAERRSQAEKAGGRFDALLVCRGRLTAAVHEVADRLGVDLVTRTNLLRPMFQPGPATARLEDQLERVRAGGSLVDLTARVNGRAVGPDALTFLENWSVGRPSGSVLLAGAPGSGKTATLLRLAVALNRRWADPNEDDSAIGVLVDVGTFRGVTSSDLDSILFAAATRAGAITTKPFISFLRQSGYLIALIDGLDDIPASSEPILGWEEGPVIATARESAIAARVGLKPGTIAEMDRLTASQLAPLLAGLGIDDSSVQALMQVLAERPDLSMMLEGPATAALLVQAYSVSNDLPVSVDGVLELVFNRWMDRFPTASREEVRRMLIQVAQDSFLRDGDPTSLRIRLLAMKNISADEWDSLIATCPFLVRSGEFTYSFGHRILLEYFLALGLVEDLQVKRLDGPRLPPAVLDRWKARSLSKSHFSLLRTVLKDPDLPLGIRTNAFLLLYAHRATHTVHGAELDGAYLGGLDLRGARLTGAHLEAADLRNTDLTEAYLDSADLRGALLDKAVLCRANLASADLRETSILGADFTGANLTAAIVSEARRQPAGSPRSRELWRSKA